MLKFTGLSCLAILCTQTAFGPGNDFAPNIRLLYGLGIPKFCSHGPGYLMGADTLAGSILYLACFYHKIWNPLFFFIAFDAMYYGPQCLGGPMAAVFAAMTII